MTDERDVARRVLKLDAMPGAVHARMAADGERLALRAEMARRKAERAASADEREAM